MYLLVSPNGSKYWRLKYRTDGKEKLLALGVYPDTSLADARAKRGEAKRILAAGGDPSGAKKVEKQSRKAAVKNTFKQIALEWHSNKSKTWSESYSAENLTLLKNNIFPDLGGRPVAEIKPLELLDILSQIESRGAYRIFSSFKLYKQ